MKIAQVVCVYPPYKGGIGTAAVNAGRLLRASGFEVTTFTPDYGRDYEPEDGLVRIKTPIKSGNAAFLPALAKELAPFDIIYLHYPFFGAEEVIWFLKKFFWKSKKRLVIQYHMDAALSGFLGRAFLKTHDFVFGSLFEEADLILSASLDYVQSSKLGAFYKKAKDKFLEIPYGLDTDKFKPASGEIRDGAFKVLFVGGLDRAHYFKGVGVLLEAAAELKGEGREFIVELIGSGDLEQEYKSRAEVLGVKDVIVFSGKVGDDDLPEKYRRADVTVLPSINSGEAFGIVLTESMACGTPVIASDLPGVRSVFSNGNEGLLVKTGSVDDLADKLRFFMDYGTRRRQMGEAARKKAVERYSYKAVGQALAWAFKNLENK
jgi:glycosyltransferase involved in cell wall biosynthesis